MLIRLMYGAREGQVVDLLPREARAMLADGRATLPSITPGDRDPAPALVTTTVATRADRGMPRQHRRATR